ncbi:hypothetical protein [Actinoplanes sp. NPDC051859]|uniref:hypothetical protein n=1 Tax=Actinoplanes sp. NPDC051859 TaxID=3363909 RepID=UPI0037A3B3FF
MALTTPAGAQAAGVSPAPVSAAAATSLSLGGPATVARLGALTLSGTLGVGAGTLTVSRKDLTGTHALPSVSADASGAFTVRDKPAVGGSNTYTVSWAGDGTADAATAQANVVVSRRATKVTIKTDASTYNYRGVATITAAVGTTHDSRALCVYATPRGGTKTKVKCGTGTVTATYKPTRRTTFSAAYAGDQWFLPASASRTVATRAGITQLLGNHYGSSGKYKLYRTTAVPVFGIGVSPDHVGGCATADAQVYYGGKWKALGSAKCITLNEDSVATGYLDAPRVKGLIYRIRGGFAGDSTNAATAGSWMYLKFAA